MRAHRYPVRCAMVSTAIGVQRSRLRPAADRATARRVVCAAGHAFDVARSGYLSLLQPQDRRSRAPGDSKESVAARARLLEAGIGRAAIDAIVAARPSSTRRGRWPPTSAAGRASCSARWPPPATSAASASTWPRPPWSGPRAATRRSPGSSANADRRLPLLDASVHLVLSLNGRRNPDECARVLVPGGTLIVGVPAPTI